MKYILTGDTHLGLQKSSEIWHNVVSNLYDELYDVCVRKNIDNIIHTGDFFHERETINKKTLTLAQNIIEKTPTSVIHWIIVGNHDTYYKTNIHPHALQVFKNYNEVVIADELCDLNNIALIPWGTHISKIKTDKKICIGHFEITDFYMNNSFLCKTGDHTADNFKQFDLVLSGHFHTPSEKNNIKYIGSPFQMTFNDSGSTRGYYIFDDDTLDLEFFEFDAPKFIKLKINEGVYDKDIINGNVVKIIFDKDYGTSDNEKIVNEISNLHPLRLHTDFSNVDNEKVTDIPDETMGLIDNRELMLEYIGKKKLPENIKRSVLINVFRKLVEE